EREDLGSARFGLDAKLVSSNELFEPPLVAREPKEPVSFLDELRRRGVLRTQARDELLVRVKLLAADAVQAAVRLFVDVAGRGAASPELLDGDRMSRIAPRLDEAVELDAELRCERAEAGGVVADELRRRAALLRGRAHIFQRIVVAAAHELDAPPARTMKAR